MRDDSTVRTRIAGLSSQDRLAICTIVRGEIQYGIERLPHGKRREDLGAKAQHIFAAVPCESIPPAAADAYARLKREAEQAGTPLDENDLWIAATCDSVALVLPGLRQSVVSVWSMISPVRLS
jgi:predicted nucleic acid-binding protein